jgi:NADPH2:quinone reductase
VTLRGIADVQVADDQLRLPVSQALAAAVAGDLRPMIGQTFRLERAAAAHAIEARRVIGKTLLVTHGEQPAQPDVA